MSSRKRIADALEALLEGMASLEARASRTEGKVDAVLERVGNVEAATVELSREVRDLRDRMIEEAEIRAGLGQALLEHDVELSLIRGGRDG